LDGLVAKADALTGILTALIHWAAQNRQDFDEALERAAERFELKL
jgi:hypothetical protein